MKDENNQNLFETVFQGVEPPKYTDTNQQTNKEENKKEVQVTSEIQTSIPTEEVKTTVVEQPSNVNPEVITDQTVLNTQLKSEVEPPLPSNIDSVAPQNSVIPTDDKRLNPIIRLLVYLLLLAAILFSLYNLIVVPVMKVAQEKEIEHERLEKVEDYLKDVEVSLQANSDLQNIETCQIISSGKYCTTDEDIIDDSSALKVQSKQSVEGGMLFFKDGMVYSGYVYLDGHTYNIQDGVVKEKEKVEENIEEEQ